MYMGRGHTSHTGTTSEEDNDWYPTRLSNGSVRREDIRGGRNLGVPTTVASPFDECRGVHSHGLPVVAKSKRVLTRETGLSRYEASTVTRRPACQIKNACYNC